MVFSPFPPPSLPVWLFQDHSCWFPPQGPEPPGTCGSWLVRSSGWREECAFGCIAQGSPSWWCIRVGPARLLEASEGDEAGLRLGCSCPREGPRSLCEASGRVQRPRGSAVSSASYSPLSPAQGFGRTEAAKEQGAQGVNTGAGFQAGNVQVVWAGRAGGAGLGSPGWQKPWSWVSWWQHQGKVGGASFSTG